MLHVIGIGPGRAEWLPPATLELIKQCDVLVGGTRALQLFPDFPGQQGTLSGDLTPGLKFIRSALFEEKTVGVLVSGDPGFFSLLPLLQREFPEEKMTILPGISSLQFVFARAGLPWQDAAFISVHGRDLSVLPRQISRPTAVLTGGENTPQKVAQLYLERGINPVISIGNALGYPEEVWMTKDAEYLAQTKLSLKNATLILHPTSRSHVEADIRLGIPDRDFIRGDVPMTKAEIRVQVLAKAQISSQDNVLDIGAGTGSISIEAAAIANEGTVYAVEQHAEAQELILANQQKFGIPNLQMIPGRAPEVLKYVPPVDVCIVGGSNGQLSDILKEVPLVKGGRVVITAVTLETVAQALQSLKILSFQDIEVVSIQAVRWNPVQNLHMAQAINPVFILSAYKGEAI